jgi:hypothetical protein
LTLPQELRRHCDGAAGSNPEKTSFPPDFPNKTTLVAVMEYHPNLITSLLQVV